MEVDKQRMGIINTCVVCCL